MDDEADYALDVRAGVVPLALRRGALEPDPRMGEGLGWTLRAVELVRRARVLAVGSFTVEGCLAEPHETADVPEWVARPLDSARVVTSRGGRVKVHVALATVHYVADGRRERVGVVYADEQLDLPTPFELILKTGERLMAFQFSSPLSWDPREGIRHEIHFTDTEHVRE